MLFRQSSVSSKWSSDPENEITIIPIPYTAINTVWKSIVLILYCFIVLIIFIFYCQIALCSKLSMSCYICMRTRSSHNSRADPRICCSNRSNYLDTA